MADGEPQVGPLFNDPAAKGEMAVICAQLSFAITQVSLALMALRLNKHETLTDALEQLDNSQAFFMDTAEKIYGFRIYER